MNAMAERDKSKMKCDERKTLSYEKDALFFLLSGVTQCVQEEKLSEERASVHISHGCRLTQGAFISRASSYSLQVRVSFV